MVTELRQTKPFPHSNQESHVDTNLCQTKPLSHSNQESHVVTDLLQTKPLPHSNQESHVVTDLIQTKPKPRGSPNSCAKQNLKTWLSRYPAYYTNSKRTWYIIYPDMKLHLKKWVLLSSFAPNQTSPLADYYSTIKAAFSLHNTVFFFRKGRTL